ncbi:MAG: glycosyltransferase family 2 protein [Synergistaceae bacterium]|nr:glycosyltransferase family 2 protein [Synergistaceae bacterium]
MHNYAQFLMAQIVYPLNSGDLWSIVFRFVPFVLFFELPLAILIIAGVFKYTFERMREGERRPYFPPVSCIITCYSEGLDVQRTISSLTEQIYPGKIEIFAMIDGAAKNKATYEAATGMVDYVSNFDNRKLVVIPKWQRGGRVSSLNTGLSFANGEIIMALDGDTSFDNNMIERATRHFEDPAVAAVSGCLRVRNADDSLAASLQAIEYFISIQASKTGLSTFNVVNNISGAFGIFRRRILDLVGGWDAGTAEDLDLTLRIKNYFGRYKDGFKIIFDPEAIGHTDVPRTFKGFLLQRIRWDGDLSYLYFRKHWHSFDPRLLGWPNFIMILLTGLFSQIAMPIVIFLYTVWLFAAYPLRYALSLLLLIYMFYFAMLTIMYLIFVMCLSERPRDDMSRVCFLPIMPLFAFIARINSLVAMLWELVASGHKDSSMAPWWVTKKSKF